MPNINLSGLIPNYYLWFGTGLTRPPLPVDDFDYPDPEFMVDPPCVPVVIPPCDRRCPDPRPRGEQERREHAYMIRSQREQVRNQIISSYMEAGLPIPREALNSQLAQCFIDLNDVSFINECPRDETEILNSQGLLNANGN